MLSQLNAIYLRQRFFINGLSLFINPFFFIRRGLLRGIRKFAPQLSGRLLDFGCGSKPYRELFSVNEYIGVDMEQTGHAHLKEELLTIDVFYDGKTIPFPNNHFDSVFCSEVFEHIFNLDDMLVEINRVVKPGGMALFTVPFVWNEHEVPYDFGRYSSFGITHLMQKHGFELIELHKTTHFAEVLCQLWLLYLRDLLYTSNKYLNIGINLLFIAPFTIISLLLTAVLPKNHSLYHNNVVLARKMQLTINN
ncbi:MAG: class I SAM-dependent methyltransferase [Bacteroidota bacterium]